MIDELLEFELNNSTGGKFDVEQEARGSGPDRYPYEPMPEDLEIEGAADYCPICGRMLVANHDEVCEYRP